jgi:predicted permease
MMAVTGTAGQSVGRTLISIPAKVLLHPFIIATLVGVAGAAVQFQPPAVVEQLLTFLRSSAAPCALFALGVTVALRPLKKVPAELPVLIAIKLLVHPLIVYLLLSWVGGFDRTWIYTAILMACLPPAATIYVLATQYDTYIMRGSSAILIGTAVSVITVTLVLYLVTENLLPDDPLSLMQGYMPWNFR